MINTDTYLPKPLIYHCDTKSQASTQGQENCQFASHENFGFSLTQSQDLRNTKSKIKSSLCKNFTENAYCPYGSKCQFAHGTHQLKINHDVNNSYKTKPCNAFFKKGHCQYGYRCNFVHSEARQPDEENKWKKIYSNNRDLLQTISHGQESKLLKILE